MISKLSVNSNSVQDEHYNIFFSDFSGWSLACFSIFLLFRLMYSFGAAFSNLQWCSFDASNACFRHLNYLHASQGFVKKINQFSKKYFEVATTVTGAFEQQKKTLQ